MRKITFTSSFDKDAKLAKKRHYAMKKLAEVMKLLSNGDLTDPKYKDHPLSGNKAGFRECHLEPDWLLVYQSSPDEVILVRTGTHSDLFHK
jgi:mRNA interferase YafQ